MARRKASDFVEGRVKGGSLGLGHFEIVRCWAFKEEIFQSWIPKIRISTKSGTKPCLALKVTAISVSQGLLMALLKFMLQSTSYKVLYPLG